MRSHKAVMIMMMGVEPPSAPVQRKLTQGGINGARCQGRFLEARVTASPRKLPA